MVLERFQLKVTQRLFGTTKDAVATSKTTSKDDGGAPGRLWSWSSPPSLDRGGGGGEGGEGEEEEGGEGEATQGTEAEGGARS